MLWRATLAFLALPGVVAFAVPLLMISLGRIDQHFGSWGLIPLGPGIVLLLWCVREFSVAGRGTLAPWSPPQHLVTSGPYRYSRNPMYVAVLLILAGWAIGFSSIPLLSYALCVAIAFQLRVLVGEEPWLAQTHGEAWREYAGRVSRWIGPVKLS